MSVIGIDPGTSITGYGIIEENIDGEIRLIDFGVIKPDFKIPLNKNLLTLFLQLNELINLHKPQQSAVEKLFFQRNLKTASSVGEARGIILLALAQANIPVYEYNPMEVKQSVTGYGHADKKQVQQMVQTLLRLKEIPRPDDAADALAIAICHIHSRKMIDSTNLNEY